MASPFEILWTAFQGADQIINNPGGTLNDVNITAQLAVLASSASINPANAPRNAVLAVGAMKLQQGVMVQDIQEGAPIKNIFADLSTYLGDGAIVLGSLIEMTPVSPALVPEKEVFAANIKAGGDLVALAGLAVNNTQGLLQTPDALHELSTEANAQLDFLEGYKSSDLGVSTPAGQALGSIIYELSNGGFRSVATAIGDVETQQFNNAVTDVTNGFNNISTSLANAWNNTGATAPTVTDTVNNSSFAVTSSDNPFPTSGTFGYDINGNPNGVTATDSNGNPLQSMSASITSDGITETSQGYNSAGTIQYTNNTTFGNNGQISADISGTGDNTFLTNANITLAASASATVNGDSNTYSGGAGSTFTNNNSDGTSQLGVFAPTSSINSDFQDYSGANGTGQMLQDFTDYTNGLNAQTDYSYNSSEQLTQTVQTDAFANSDLTVQNTTQLDGNGNTTNYSVSVDEVSQQLSLDTLSSEFGSQVGQAIGQAIGGNNIFASVTGSTVGAIVIGDIVKATTNLSTSLLQNIAGSSQNAVQIGVGNTFGNLGGDNGISTLNNSSVGDLTAVLVSEAAQSLGLSGFTNVAFTTTGRAITSQIVSNISQGQTLLNGFDSTALLDSVGLNLGAVLGNVLGSSVVNSTNVAQSVLTSFGGFAGGQIGGAVVTDAINCTSDMGVLSSELASTGAISTVEGILGESLADIILPGVGALLGAVLGEVAGDAIYTFLNDITFGLFSHLFGGGGSWHFVSNGYDPTTNSIVRNYDNSKNTNASLRQGTYDLDNAFLQTVNSTITDIGGVVDQAAWNAATHTTYFFDTYFSNTYSVQVGGSPWQIASGGDGAYIERIGVENELSQMVFDNGDLVKLRAFNAWKATVNVASITGNSLTTLTSYMQIASDYDNYLNNTADINTLMAAEPNSAFALGWLATLLQAQAMGLNNINYAGTVYNLAGGGSQMQVTTGLPSGEISLTENYTGSYATGTLTNEIINFTDGTSQNQIFVGLDSDISEETLTYTGANASGTVTEKIIDYTAGNSQLQMFTDSSDSTTEQDYGYAGSNGTGSLLYTQTITTELSTGQVTATISGQGDTGVFNNATITLAANTQATIIGINNTVTGSSATITLSAGSTGNTVTGDNNTINAAAGDNFTVTGNGNTINAVNNDSFSVTGTGDTINAATNVAFSVTGNGATINGFRDVITLGSGVTGATINGGNNAINAANNDNFTVTGIGDTINGNGYTIALGSGVSDDTINGNSDTISTAANDSFTVTGTGDTINGNNDTISAATNIAFSVTGTGDTINGFRDVITLGSGVTGATINGGNNAINAANNDNFTVTGIGDTINGNGYTIALGSGVSDDTINGNSDTISTAANDSFTVTGTGDTINGNNDTITLSTNNASNTVTGNNNTINAGANNQFTITGSNNTINESSDIITLGTGSTGDTITGSGNTINVAAGDSVTVSGVDNKIVASSATITLAGGAPTPAGPANTIIANIAGANDPSDVALTPDGFKVLATNFNLNTVSVFDTATNNLIATIPVGSKPTCVAFTADGSKAYVGNYGTDTVSVVDMSTYNVISTITVGSVPYAMTTNLDGSKVYVANNTPNTISVIDTATDTVSSTVVLSGKQPAGMAVSPDGRTLYVANGNSNNVSVVNTSTNTEIGSISVGSIPIYIAITPDGTKAYVTNLGSNTVSVINLTTNTVTGTIAVGTQPVDIAITPDGTTAYVANMGSNTVSVISLATNTVIATLATSAQPQMFAVSPDGSKLYLSSYNTTNNNLSVISTGLGININTLTGNNNTVNVAAGDNVTVTGNNDTIIASSAIFNQTANAMGNTIAGDANVTINGENETLVGNGGYNIYNFVSGDGADVIQNGTSTNAGPSGELDFGAGITASNVAFNKVGNDLAIGVIGSTDQVTVQGWFSNSYSQLQAIQMGDGTRFLTVNSTEILANNTTAGTSEAIIFAPSGSIASEIENFSGLNGTGAVTNATYNWVAGGSQEDVFTGLPAGASEEILNYSHANDGGTLVNQTYNWTAGGSQMEWFNPSSSIATTIQNFAGSFGTGTLNNATYNWIAGGSQEDVFTGLPAGASEEILNYSQANDGGTLVNQTYNWTAGGSQMEWFNPSSSIATMIQNFAGSFGTGTLNNATYNWVAGGSQVQKFTGLPSGVAEKITNFTGANGTGTLTSTSLIGSANNDTIAAVGGPETIDGAGGTNTISYAASTVAVTVNLITGTDSLGNTLLNFQNIIGSNHGDTLIVGNGLHTLTGGSGNDTFKVGTLTAGSVIQGSSGTNTLVVTSGDISQASISNIQNLQVSGSAIASATQVVALVTISGLTAPYTLTVSDTAANVQTKLATLETLAASGKITSITLTNTTTPTFTLTAAQFAADTAALSKITSAYNVSVTGVAAANAASVTATAHVTSVTVSDTAANVQANLTALQTLVTNANLTSIALTDSTTPTLALTAPQVTNDAGVLGKITSAYKITVSDTAANMQANLAALETLAKGTKLTSITLTDSTTPTLALTAAQFSADTAALGKITSAYNVTVSGVTAANATSIAATAHVASVTVSDTAANALTNIAALETLATTGTELTSITLTNTTTPTLALTAAQSTNDAAALGKIASAHNETISGGSGNDTLVAAAAGNDTLTGGGGSDTYVFGSTFGTDTINNLTPTGKTANGQVNFGAGITDENLWFEKTGNNLEIVLLGTNDTVTLSNWYGGNASAQVKSFNTSDGLKIDSQIAQLVSAMASYQTAHSAFNPSLAGTQMPGDPTLQATIAAAWHA